MRGVIEEWKPSYSDTLMLEPAWVADWLEHYPEEEKGDLRLDKDRLISLVVKLGEALEEVDIPSTGPYHPWEIGVKHALEHYRQGPNP